MLPVFEESRWDNSDLGLLQRSHRFHRHGGSGADGDVHHLHRPAGCSDRWSDGAVEQRLGRDRDDHGRRIAGDGDDDSCGAGCTTDIQRDGGAAGEFGGDECDEPNSLRVSGEARRDEPDQHFDHHGLQPVFHGHADTGDDGDVHVVGAALLHVRGERDPAVVQRTGGCDGDDHDWWIIGIRVDHGAGTERELDLQWDERAKRDHKHYLGELQQLLSVLEESGWDNSDVGLLQWLDRHNRSSHSRNLRDLHDLH